MKAIGVFSARVRVEEKQIIAAASATGAIAVPVLPASTPLPPGLASPNQAMLGDLRNGTGSGEAKIPVDVLIDRCANRAVAAVSLRLARIGGIKTIDAGLAAIGTRIEIASMLESSGIPRPRSLIGFSEDSAVAAANRLGYPVTLLGLMPGSSTTALHDVDTGDAVIEHRVVLGDASEAIVLLQAGIPTSADRALVHVVDGRAVAVSGSIPEPAGLALAEQAARSLGAAVIGIELARTSAGLVVWDALPVVDFRQAVPLEDLTVADAIAQLAERVLRANGHTGVPAVEEVQRGFALSA